MILAFSTGLDSFSNPGDIGAMYPFREADWLFVLIGVILWLLWHVGQIRGETLENEQSRAAVEALGLERVMYYGGSAIVPTDQEWEEAGRHGYPGAPHLERPPLREPGAPPPRGAPPGTTPPPP